MNKIETTAENLVAALKNMGKVAKGNMEILATVLIEYSPKLVTVTATNSTQQVMRSAEGFKVTGKGEVAINAERLISVTQTLPADQKVAIEIEGDKAILKSGRSRLTFQTFPADVFPKLPAPAKDDARIEVGDDFRRALETTRHAIASNEVNWTLCGTMMDADGLVASDGKRLAMRAIAGPPKPVVVPTDAVDLILSSDTGAKIEIAVSDRIIWIDFGNGTKLVSKLVDHVPPTEKYRGLARFDPVVSCHINRGAMIAALNRLAIMADDKDRAVVFSIDSGAGMATISNAWGSEETPCEANADIRIGFKGPMLRESLSSLSADDVDFHMTEPQGAVRIDGGPDDATLVVMPFKI